MGVEKSQSTALGANSGGGREPIRRKWRCKQKRQCAGKEELGGGNAPGGNPRPRASHKAGQ